MNLTTIIEQEIARFDVGLAGALMQDSITRDSWVDKHLQAFARAVVQGVVDGLPDKERGDSQTAEFLDMKFCDGYRVALSAVRSELQSFISNKEV